MIIKTALYLRKSREDMTETKEDTLARHERQLIDYCKRYNLSIVATYKEVVSGESIANRPQMQQLLNDVALNKFDAVACIELERLSRGNQLDQCEILEVFKSSNTKIHTLNKIYDLSKDEVDEEFFEFALFMSRREYKIITRRLQRGRMQALNEGYYIGSVLPFGFDKIKGDKGYILTPNADAETVKMIFKKYLEGVNVAAIANYLNDNGIKPHRSTKWTQQTIRNVLRNKVYIGLLNANKRDAYVVGKHVPIIDNTDFMRVQDKLAKTPKVSNKRALSNPLAGLVYCSECGRAMLRTVNGLNFEYIKCPTLRCPTRSIKLADLERYIMDEISKELKDFNYFIDNYADEIKEQKEQIEKEIALLNIELNKKVGMIEKACEMLESGIYTKELFTRRVGILEADISTLKDNITALKNKPLNDDTRAYKAIPILEKVLEKYYNLDIENKNLLLKSIIKRVEYTRLQEHIDLDIMLLL